MLELKDARKLPYTELDEETKEYIYDLFKRYVVRRQITEQNKELTKLFSHRYGNNPREYSACFNSFNSSFLNTNLIRELDYDEIHTDFLREMSEDRFNYQLAKARTFDRKMALICFSGRPSERMANRMEFPVMVAYANMQSLVLEMAKSNPRVSFDYIFEEARKKIRYDFYQTNGYKINQSNVLPERVDYKSIGKKCAKLWKEMLEFYMTGLKEVKTSEAVAFIAENFIFTDRIYQDYNDSLAVATKKGENSLESQRAVMEEQKERFPESYDVADYEEVMFSQNYENETIMEYIRDVMFSIFHEYLEDPIFAPKAPKEGAGKGAPKIKN